MWHAVKLYILVLLVFLAIDLPGWGCSWPNFTWRNWDPWLAAPVRP